MERITAKNNFPQNQRVSLKPQKKFKNPLHITLNVVSLPYQIKTTNI